MAKRKGRSAREATRREEKESVSAPLVGARLVGVGVEVEEGVVGVKVGEGEGEGEGAVGTWGIKTFSGGGVTKIGASGEAE